MWVIKGVHHGCHFGIIQKDTSFPYMSNAPQTARILFMFIYSLFSRGLTQIESPVFGKRLLFFLFDSDLSVLLCLVFGAKSSVCSDCVCI